MAGGWLPALAALFAWWFSTGAILMAVKHADRRKGRAHLVTVALAAPLALAGVWGFDAASGSLTAGAVYGGCLAALAIWGWIELAFLAGVVTGPNAAPCPPRIAGWERFIRAWGTLAYHEMLLAAVAVAMGIMAWDAPNPFGFYTFAFLFAARISAKLNLFFGVLRVHTEFLPRPLAHLPSYFRLGSISGVYPVSITLLSLTLGCWTERLIAAQGAAEAAGFGLLAALTALALLEHWLMVLPLPDQKLWRWMLPAPKPTRKMREDAHGL